MPSVAVDVMSGDSGAPECIPGALLALTADPSLELILVGQPSVIEPALANAPASVRSREQGTVVLRVLVDARGSAQRIELVRSSGHVRLDEAARDAVGRARFQPVLRNGEAIPAWGLVPVAFRLDRA